MLIVTDIAGDGYLCIWGESCYTYPVILPSQKGRVTERLKVPVLKTGR